MIGYKMNEFKASPLEIKIALWVCSTGLVLTAALVGNLLGRVI
jgi:hypothetical protein